MLRVVFMGTPDFAVAPLEAILRANDRFQVVGVYTQPDRPMGRGLEMRPSPVKAKAVEHGLPVLQPEKLSQPGEFERLHELRPDVLVVVAYGQILRTNVLELPRLGCVNIHSSLLPRWRGAAPIQWAILEGDAETGVTTMQMDVGLDTGPILMKASTPVSPDETAQSLHDRLSSLGAGLIIPTLDGLASGEIRPLPQENAQATYAAKLTKEMEGLDPKLPAAVLDRRVRALNPWPGTSVWTAEGERLKVKKAKLRSDIQGMQGKIFERNGMVLLGTAEGSLELQTVQWDGKKEVDPAGFLNGLQGRGKRLPIELRS